MVTITVAYTSPINVVGSNTKATLPQVWASLERKIRAAEDFVPVMARTDIIQEPTSEEPHVTTRIIHLKEDCVTAGMPALMKEICIAYKPNRVS